MQMRTSLASAGLFLLWYVDEFFNEFFYVPGSGICMSLPLRRTLVLRVILLNKVGLIDLWKTRGTYRKNYVVLYVLMFLCGSKNFLHLSFCKIAFMSDCTEEYFSAMILSFCV